MSTSSEDQPHNIDWITVVDNWRESGLPMNRYCQQHGLITHQLSYYKRKFESANNVGEASAKGFTQVAVENVNSTKGLTLRLSSGAVIEGITQQNLPLTASLVQALL